MHGIGNDGKYLEGNFENWKEKIFWKTLKSTYLKNGTSILSDVKKNGCIKKQEMPFSIQYHPDLQVDLLCLIIS